MSDEVLVWLSVWSEVHMVQLMPLHPQTPLHLLPHLNPDWFYLFGTSLPKLSWKRGR